MPRLRIGGISVKVVEIQKATQQKQMMTPGASQRSIREFLDFGKFVIYFLIRRGGRIKLPRIAFIRPSQALSERRSFH